MKIHIIQLMNFWVLLTINKHKEKFEENTKMFDFLFKSKPRLCTTIIIILFIAYGIYDRFCIVQSFGGIVVLICVIYFWFGKDYKCPNCKRKFHLKKLNEVIIDKKDISVPIETYIKDSEGKIKYTSVQYVPGKRYTYRINKICKKCGEKCYSEYTKDKASL